MSKSNNKNKKKEKNKKKKERGRERLPTEHRRSQSLDGSDNDPTSMRSKNCIATRYTVYG